MRESLPLSYRETIENTSMEELLKLYEVALRRCNFRYFETQKSEGKLHHKATWGKKRPTERKRFITRDAIREEMQRFCAKASFEQVGNDVRFIIEVIPWMESADKPEEFDKTQGLRERAYDEIYARQRLEEILSAMPGVGMEADDLLFAPHYEDLQREEKLRRLEQRFRDGKMSKEMYDSIREWIEAGN